jgi:hypothetical protein
MGVGTVMPDSASTSDSSVGTPSSENEDKGIR